MKILIFFFMFLVLGGLFILGDGQLSLGQDEHREKFYALYLQWLGSVFENAKTITGQVLHLDWLPEE